MTALGCARYEGATFASTISHTSDTQKIALFFEKELSEPRRRIRDAAVRVKLQVVYRGAGLSALEVEQRNIFGCQHFAANLHTNAVNEVIAVGLDDKPAFTSYQPREEAAQFSLCS